MFVFALCTASVPSSTQSLEQILANVKKEQQHIPMVRLPHAAANNASINMLPDMKNPVNMLPAGLPANLNLGGLNIAGLNLNQLQQGLSAVSSHLGMNSLESLINTSSPMASIQNSHSMTMAQQQHSNGFSSMKRENSPTNLLNNNGLANLGINLGGLPTSIFDPLSMVLPAQMPQLTIKKEDNKSMIAHQLLAQQKMDGKGIQFEFIFHYFIMKHCY